ncbi:hypothetical cytosolic protein [Syntrophus aciditrophicus SB]|uniref:Hypothetical cytosolic protein n=1 Tax=Syntrophus aciditrophicus (strain SB) TaxID=56780 RepID=Q2LVT2_SYNAS|nr:hypothetical cytosolic protein [Syntrophus aciditrophicus SB]
MKGRNQAFLNKKGIVRKKPEGCAGWECGLPEVCMEMLGCVYGCYFLPAPHAGS